MEQRDFNPFGFNWVDGPTANRGRWTSAIQAWNPISLSVNSLDAARHWRAALPHAVIGFRNMAGPGADNQITVRLSPAEWYDKWEPLLPELRRLKVHAILGNEPHGYGDSLEAVAINEVEIIKRLNDAGVSGMACRFPVGHPDHRPAELEKLLPLFELLRQGDHYWMVNEYAWFDHDILDQRAYIGRFQAAWDVLGEVPTIIGEISENTHHPLDYGQQDSASGYRVSGLSGTEFAHRLQLAWDNIYDPAGVHSAHIFIAGGAHNQRQQDILGDDQLFNSMTNYRPLRSFERLPVLAVPEDTLEPNVTLIPRGNYSVRVRLQPTLQGEIVGSVIPGGIRAFDPGKMSGDYGSFLIDELWGYVHMDYIMIIRDNPNVNPSLSQALLYKEIAGRIAEIATQLERSYKMLNHWANVLDDPPPPLDT